jgi:hypothetical protein
MALLGKPFREGLSYKPCPSGYEDVRDFPPYLRAGSRPLPQER